MEAVADIRERTRHPVKTEKADDLPPGFLLRLLDEIDYGLVLVDEQGKIQHANHLARHELARGRLLDGAIGETITGRTAALGQQLMAAVRGALQGRRRLLLATVGVAAFYLLIDLAALVAYLRIGLSLGGQP